MKKIEIIIPNQFEQENHFYPKALNSQLHGMVGHFFNISHVRIPIRAAFRYITQKHFEIFSNVKRGC